MATLAEQSIRPQETTETASVMSREEAFATFDAAARRYLNMSGAEFQKKWKCGFFDRKHHIGSKVDAVSILLPLIER